MTSSHLCLTAHCL